MPFSYAQIQQCISILIQPYNMFIHSSHSNMLPGHICRYTMIVYACSCTLRAPDKTRKLQLCTETVTITDPLFSSASLPFSHPRSCHSVNPSSAALSLSFTLSVLLHPFDLSPPPKTCGSPATVNICWWTLVCAFSFTHDCLCIYLLMFWVI